MSFSFYRHLKNQLKLRQSRPFFSVKWSLLGVGATLCFFLFLSPFLTLNASTSSSAELSPQELEAWLSYHQGSLSYGAYAPHPTESTWVPVGWSRYTVRHHQGQHENYVVTSELKLNQDRYGKPSDLHQIETRTYSTLPPYPLIELEISETHQGKRYQSVYHSRSYPKKPTPENLKGWTNQGVWTGELPEGKIHKEITTHETLRTQVGFPLLHLFNPQVGTSFNVPTLIGGQDHDFELKLIDHRFQLRGGLWTEMLELSTLDKTTSKTSKHLIDPYQRTWLTTVADQLVLLRQPSHKAYAPLPLKHLQPTRSLIQRQKGRLTEPQIQKQLQSRKGKVKSCYQAFLKRVPQTSLTWLGEFYVDPTGQLQALSLKIDPQTKLSPQAQRFLKPFKTCLYKSMNGLRFSRPLLKSKKKDEPVAIASHLQGTTFSYPFRFTP